MICPTGKAEYFCAKGWTAVQISRDSDQALLRLGHHLRPTNRHQSRNKESAGQQRSYEEDEAKRDQHHSCPSCHQLPVVLVRVRDRSRARSRRTHGGGRRVFVERRIRQKHLYVDRVWCGVVGGEPIDCGLGSDGCRGHGRRGRGHGSFVDHLGRRCCRLRRVRRCGAQQLIPRIQNRPVTQRDLVLLGSDDWPLRGITMNRLVHRMSSHRRPGTSICGDHRDDRTSAGPAPSSCRVAARTPLSLGLEQVPPLLWPERSSRSLTQSGHSPRHLTRLLINSSLVFCSAATEFCDAEIR